MKKLLLTIGLLFIAHAVFAQWEKVYTHDNSSLADLHTFSADKVIVSGPYGEYLLRTTDGGANWDTLSPGNVSNMRMHFIDDIHGFVSGYAPFATGPTFFKTNDGGNAWEPMNYSISATASNSAIFFMNEHTGWIADGFQLLKTTGAGDTFLSQTITDVDYNYIKSIYFVDENTGIVATQFGETASEPFTGNKIFKTTDGGESWTLVYQDNDMGSNSFVFAGISKLEFTDALHGYAVGGEGKTLRTTDGGDTWEALSENFDYNIDDIDLLTFEKGYVASGGKVYYTADGMQTWTLQEDSNHLFDIYALSMLNDSVGYASGHGIFKTGNGGGTLSLEEAGLHFSFHVYPNPVESLLHLEIPANIQIRAITLTGINGRKVLNIHKDARDISVTGLPGGVYILQIQTKQGAASKKILVW